MIDQPDSTPQALNARACSDRQGIDLSVAAPPSYAVAPQSSCSLAIA